MTKCKPIQAIAAKAGLTNVQAEAALDVFGAVIIEAPVADKKTQLPGVFTASTTQHTEYGGCNPATDEVTTIPARRVAKLAPVSVPKNAL